MEIVSIVQSDRPHTPFPDYHSDCWRIVYIRRGTCELLYEERRYPLRPGNLAMIPPDVPGHILSEKDFLDICMYVKGFRPIGNVPFRIFHDDERGSISALMDMAADFSDPDDIYERAVLNAVADLLYQVLVCIYVDHQKKDIRLEDIMEEMQINVGNPDFDLAAAIEKKGYSGGHFRKIFKALTGQSPVAYLQTLRINQARSLLDQFGVSRNIKDIARSCGFRDPLYFSRVFKKSEGMSPTEYVKRQAIHRSLKLTADEVDLECGRYD